MSGAVITAVKVGANAAEVAAAALDALISAEDFAGVMELCEATAGEMPYAEGAEGLFREGGEAMAAWRCWAESCGDMGEGEGKG